VKETFCLNAAIKKIFGITLQTQARELNR